MDLQWNEKICYLYKPVSGKYNFKIKATNSDGVWNNSPTQIYHYSAFLGNLVVLLINHFIFLRDFYLRFIGSYQTGFFIWYEFKNKITSDLHDDIRSPLTRISMESELLNSNINISFSGNEKRISQDWCYEGANVFWCDQAM